MKNMTITVKEDVAQWARVWAAKNGTSVSRIVGELLEKMMMEEDGYRTAQMSYLSRKPNVISKSGPYPSRDELHAR